MFEVQEALEAQKQEFNRKVCERGTCHAWHSMHACMQRAGVCTQRRFLSLSRHGHTHAQLLNSTQEQP